MKQKHVDAMREVRLWIGQIIIPGIIIYNIPEVKRSVQQAKEDVKLKFNKHRRFEAK